MKITDILRKNVLSSLEDLNLNEKNILFEKDILIENPADTTHGDFATNIALVLFGKLKKELGEDFVYNSPRDLAQAISDVLNQKLKLSSSEKVSSDLQISEFAENIKEITVAGPGFINFTLSDAFLLSKMGLIIKNGGDITEKIGNNQKIVAEYSSPNIAKPFTVGHLRSTIIGDALANIFESSGYKVFRDNHLGDWGTQFGKQIYAIKTWGDEDQIANSENPVKELVKLYVKFHEEVDKDETIADKGREWFTKLENGDFEARRLWEKCITWSWVEFEKIYKKLGVTFTENNGLGYGESFFEDKMDSVVTELEEKNLLKESEGAKLVFFPEDKYPPLMVIKKDGSTLYSTRDLATDKFRLEQYGSNVTVFNEVGSEQSLYFKQLFEVEQMLGWYKPEQRVHIGHGLIRFKDKKMSTRKGNVIWLEDVLSESYKRVREVSKGLSSDDIWKIAIGALKWNDLKRKYHLPFVFDWDELTNIKGNSGPYMQYTYVRCMSVLEKAEKELFSAVTLKKNSTINDQSLAETGASGREDSSVSESDITNHFDTLLNNKEYFEKSLNMNEKDLLRNLYKYSDVVSLSAKEYSPHYIATYLYELAQSFNTFYGNNKVVTESSLIKNGLGENKIDETTQLRLLLVQSVGLVIKHGLKLLGIDVVGRM